MLSYDKTRCRDLKRNCCEILQAMIKFKDQAYCAERLSSSLVLEGWRLAANGSRLTANG